MTGLFHDTIAAIATAQGRAGIAIIRLSGPQSWTIACRIAHITDGSDALAGTFRYAKLRAPQTTAQYQPDIQAPSSSHAEIIDDGIVLFFKAPHSYTGEDVAELQCHGGRITARRILEATLSCGARVAEPGEFTKRAFLNGKIDLARAEAVEDLISARTERAATAAREQLDGKLSKSVNTAFDSLIDVHSSIEHLLDFDEDEVPQSFYNNTAKSLDALAASLSELSSNWHRGHLLREGALVVISGMPNAGKSSLMNAILGRSRAIVSDIPGTTRDSIEEAFDLDGIPVRLVDTAGLRSDTSDTVEAAGIERATALIHDAELHLRVVDSSVMPSREELASIKELPKDQTIIVLNKSDIAPSTQFTLPGEYHSCRVSATTGEHLEDLLHTMTELLGADDSSGSSAPEISERHRRGIVEATNAVNEACKALASGGEGLVIAAEHLAVGADALGRITGRVWSEELLDAIFSKFCVGK